MREVPVVESGDGEHSEAIEPTGKEERSPTPAYPKHTEACQMKGQERQTAYPVDAIRLALIGYNFRIAVVGVKPPENRDNQPASVRSNHSDDGATINAPLAASFS